jgi:xanthine dehydrogenase accessory factor
MIATADIISRIETDGAAVVVTVAKAAGSTPREAGAVMIVFRDGSFTGTIGGGTLEWLAQAEAQKLFGSAKSTATMNWSLGPDTGQCCGGRVSISFARIAADEAERVVDLVPTQNNISLLLFGAGHVGRALVLALAPLPFDVQWIDSRADAFPSHVPTDTKTILVSDPLSALQTARDGSLIAIMTHSHALDLAIVDAALRDDRFHYVGLIGSETKRARFTSQLKQAGHTHLERLVCPIGLKEIASKEASVIAAGIVPQLLLERQKQNTMKVVGAQIVNAG